MASTATARLLAALFFLSLPPLSGTVLLELHVSRSTEPVENFIDSTLITAIIVISGKFRHRRLRRVVRFYVVSREQFARPLAINGRVPLCGTRSPPGRIGGEGEGRKDARITMKIACITTCTAPRVRRHTLVFSCSCGTNRGCRKRHVHLSRR